MPRITVTTGARLHFGLIVAPGEQRPAFGSVGMMVGEPGFTVQMEPAATDSIAAPDAVAQRIAEFLAMYRQSRRAPPVRIEVTRIIPEHAGLGSGTQLGLAVATAQTRLFDETPASIWQLSQLLGRGRRSAIGVHGFEHGGCIFAGRWQPGTISLPVPEPWRIVLVTPPGRQGLSGLEEMSAFRDMAPMNAELCAQLDTLVIERWKPALEHHDFNVFSEALYEFGVAVGTYFASYQGGAFAHPRMGKLVEHLRHHSVRGVAQTSWGPTIAVMCSDDAVAERVAVEISSDERWADCLVRRVRPLNHGAWINV